MSAGVVSFLFAIGASTWIYAKFQRSSGNNTQQSLIAAGICFVLIFIVSLFIFKAILK
jgi:membrane protein YdbS with pleckstrin-like domain